jgi:hypothetical protein
MPETLSRRFDINVAPLRTAAHVYLRHILQNGGACAESFDRRYGVKPSEKAPGSTWPWPVSQSFTSPARRTPKDGVARFAQHERRQMSQQAERSGRCLCRCVSYTFRPAEPEVAACHCSTCQTWSGWPSLSMRAAAPVDVTGREHLAVCKSSEWGERHFCRKCGSHLFYSAPTFGYFGVSAGTIDDLGGLP